MYHSHTSPPAYSYNIIEEYRLQILYRAAVIKAPSSSKPRTTIAPFSPFSPNIQSPFALSQPSTRNRGVSSQDCPQLRSQSLDFATWRCPPKNGLQRHQPGTVASVTRLPTTMIISLHKVSILRHGVVHQKMGFKGVQDKNRQQDQPQGCRNVE